jgi:nitrogen fixation/metabolism regulation signal transduction histidine kinase
MTGRRRPRVRPHEQRVLFLALLAGLPGTLLAMVLMWMGGYSPRVQWTFGLLVVGSWLAFAFSARTAVIHPLHTLSNLLSALREEDFSFRGRGSGGDDALSEVMVEVNALAGTLREQRLGALEATALLRKVMDEIDVAAFTFDQERRLRLVNRAGERALARPAETLLGRTAEELDLARALDTSTPQVLEMNFPGGPGRWEVHVGTFRQQGLPHRLLVLANVSRVLREEERQAWQRLIRVLGHELNNSLTPIRSIAGSLESIVAQHPRAPDWDVDMRKGLSVIAARAEALGRFMEAYGRLARLPAPQLRSMPIAPLVRRVAGLETRLGVALTEGPEATLMADPDQLEQLLINLVRNAADAALETHGAVRAGWGLVNARNGRARQLEVFVDDDGPGLTNTANLFVPFFTTKPGGSGIGLVLARQIAEAHGGSLTLENRRPGPGCRARLRLPV